MPQEVASSIALFADDAYLYRPITSSENAKQLQRDLDKLVAWEERWSMQFHPDKCFVLRVTNKRNIINTTYNIHGKQLKNVNKAKYLGVMLSNKLSWKKHVDLMTAKANNTRIFLQRNLPKSDKTTCLKAVTKPL